jgi:hypothetical protein
MRTLILNSSNIVPNTNNSVFIYNFPSGNVKIKEGQKLALASLQMYYSNFNITNSYNNNKFSYTWIDGRVVNATIPDSFLDVEALNNYIHFVMVQNGHYYISNSGEFVYLITLLSINPNRYACERICFQTSAAIATNNQWTIPNSTFLSPAWVNPTNPIIPIFTVPVSDFGKLIGFNPGNYPNATITGTPPNQVEAPSYTSTQVFLSSFTPQITPLSSFVLTCSLINNNYAVPNNLIYSFSPLGSFGEQFSIAPYQYAFIDCQAGQYANFRVQFLDQDLRQVALQDPNITILLVILEANETISGLMQK